MTGEQWEHIGNAELHCANDSAEDIAHGFALLRRIQHARLDACRRYVRRVAVVNGAGMTLCLVLALVAGIVAEGRAQPARGILAAGAVLNAAAFLVILRATARAMQGAMIEAKAARIALAETERNAAAFAASRAGPPFAASQHQGRPYFLH